MLRTFGGPVWRLTRFLLALSAGTALYVGLDRASVVLFDIGWSLLAVPVRFVSVVVALGLLGYFGSTVWVALASAWATLTSRSARFTEPMPGPPPDPDGLTAPRRDQPNGEPAPSA
ncbi:MAG: hypothetical protein HY329_14945 [Chloroflexi bacterium]|nr:hypothetical protein [Chloroflexota bacterium]